MNNMIKTENINAALIPCINQMGDYLQKIDCNGHSIFCDIINECDGVAGDIMGELTNVLKTRFEYDVKEMNESHDSKTLENIEDRENGITCTLFRSEFFGPEVYAETWAKIFPYALKNVHPESAE